MSLSSNQSLSSLSSELRVSLTAPSVSAVIWSFRGSVSRGLALDVGETVHILEKCEGKTCREEPTDPGSVSVEFSSGLLGVLKVSRDAAFETF